MGKLEQFVKNKGKFRSTGFEDCSWNIFRDVKFILHIRYIVGVELLWNGLTNCFRTSLFLRFWHTYKRVA